MKLNTLRCTATINAPPGEWATRWKYGSQFLSNYMTWSESKRRASLSLSDFYTLCLRTRACKKNRIIIWNSNSSPKASKSEQGGSGCKDNGRKPNIVHLHKLLTLQWYRVCWHSAQFPLKQPYMLCPTKQKHSLVSTFGTPVDFYRGGLDWFTHSSLHFVFQL